MKIALRRTGRKVKAIYKPITLTLSYKESDTLMRILVDTPVKPNDRALSDVIYTIGVQLQSKQLRR